RAKMREWIENGCQLAWLIDPIDEKATIYRSDGSTEERRFEAVLSGEDVLPGFQLDLTMLRV
ncbi:MAG TPA: Uma2 family endonuclease, partial [Rhodothermales bacterium]